MGKGSHGYVVRAGDPLAAEHEAVTRWTEDALATAGQHQWYQQVELKTLESGKVFLDAKPEQARRYLLAAVEQTKYWDKESAAIRSQGKNEIERMNPHMDKRWEAVWGRRRQTAAVINALMRRALPLDKSDLLMVLEWASLQDQLSTFHMPIGAIAKSLERYAADHAPEPELLSAMRGFAARLRASHDKDVKKHGTTVEQLCAGGDAEAAAPAPAAGNVQPTPKSAPAGNPAVMSALKRYLDVAPAAEEIAATTAVGPDRFALRANSPLRDEHQLITNVIEEVLSQDRGNYHSPQFSERPTGQKILAMDARCRGPVLLAVAERHIAALLNRITDYNDSNFWQAQYIAAALVRPIAAAVVELDREGSFDFLLYLSSRTANEHALMREAIEAILAAVEREAANGSLSEGERYVLHLFRESIIVGPPLGATRDDMDRLTRMIADGATFYLVPGEAWSDALNADIRAASPAKQQAWIALLRHLLTATAARPSDKWLKTAEKLAGAVDAEDVRAALGRWLPLVSKGRNHAKLGSYSGDTRGAGDTIHEENAIALRGMLWLAPALPKADAELARHVTSVALSAYKKVPGIGPRAVKVGNAAVYTLSRMSGEVALGQLALLKVRVRFGTAQKEIEKAFDATAAAMNLPREEIEEMGVPTYGLDEVGLRRETFANGEFTAELRVDGRDAELAWLRADGKPLKSVPAKVKSEFKDDLKELQQAAKDVAAMLPAQSERIDSMFLQQKRWPVATWRERYLDHPLVGTIARRLIWVVKSGNKTTAAMWLDGKLVDPDDAPVDVPDDSTIELWHPIGRPMDDVLTWRGWLERHRVRQPFKQAHREVYILTEAERRTRTYSNRFAAHIVRQHQFNALCAARGWKNKLRLMVDDTYPPASKELPQFGLRAEYWVEGVGEDYGTDTAESGAYLRLATDQVRFYRTTAAQNYAHAGGGGYTANAQGPGTGNVNEPIPLEEVPPLALSEIMRDVDLFVGVASVGNDPAWQDGGPQGRYLAYWQGYSFGDLGETAKTRKQVLERLIPRLKIADRCSFDEKFLIVRGHIRTYKIHLGSGNILMEPNDQYLCIVPDRSAAKDATGDVFLPFEGDATLSVILSKAFLLADDTKITDTTITRQIKV